jgi:hypothetical protein
MICRDEGLPAVDGLRARQLRGGRSGVICRACDPVLIRLRPAKDTTGGVGAPPRTHLRSRISSSVAGLEPLQFGSSRRVLVPHEPGIGCRAGSLLGKATTLSLDALPGSAPPPSNGIHRCLVWLSTICSAVDVRNDGEPSYADWVNPRQIGPAGRRNITLLGARGRGPRRPRCCSIATQKELS